jgi:hypothetical protein
MPTVTEQLALLTTSVDNLTSAVNVQKVTLDNAVNTAVTAANNAVTAVTTLDQIVNVVVVNSVSELPSPVANNTIYMVRA